MGGWGSGWVAIKVFPSPPSLTLPFVCFFLWTQSRRPSPPPTPPLYHPGLRAAGAGRWVWVGGGGGGGVHEISLSPLRSLSALLLWEQRVGRVFGTVPDGSKWGEVVSGRGGGTRDEQGGGGGGGEGRRRSFSSFSSPSASVRVTGAPYAYIR